MQTQKMHVQWFGSDFVQSPPLSASPFFACDDLRLGMLQYRTYWPKLRGKFAGLVGFDNPTVAPEMANKRFHLLAGRWRTRSQPPERGTWRLARHASARTVVVVVVVVAIVVVGPDIYTPHVAAIVAAFVRSIRR